MVQTWFGGVSAGALASPYARDLASYVVVRSASSGTGVESARDNSASEFLRPEQ